MLLLGVSREDDKKVKDVFIDQLGAKYPIVTVDAGQIAGYGIKFFPSVYGIAPDGSVFSVPDDRVPSEATIEELLKDVTLAPKLPQDAKYDALRSMWDKKQYVKVGSYLTKMLAQDNLDPELRGVYEAQQAAFDLRVEGQLAKIKRFAEGPDYFGATEKLEQMEKDWKGLPVADEAKAMLSSFKQDSRIKKEVAAGKSLQKLTSRYDRSKPSQARRLHSALVKFADKNAGTHAAEAARRMLDG